MRKPLNIALVLCLATSAVELCRAQDRVGPFKHAERSVRSRDVDQQHVRLELDFDFEQQSFAGRAVHTLSLFRPLSSFELDAAEMKIEAVSLLEREVASTGDADPALRETPLTFHPRDGKLSIELGRQRAAGEELQIAIRYSVSKPRHGAHFVVPDESEQERLRMVWTQSEPEYARYWYPCVDSPSDRLTSEIVATAPAEFFVLSNGSLEGKQDLPGNRRQWHWKQSKSHVPYLLSVVAGEFEAFEQQWNGIPVTAYVPVGRLADAARSFEKTPAMLDFFSKKIGIPYPWPKYAQICVDEYGWGGMEHTSATTLNVRTLHDERAHLDVDSDNLVAHELAHQWWGDLLTCKDWGEIWLNESFATYFATLWTEHDEGADEAAWQRHEEALAYLDEDKRYRRSIVNYRYDTPNNVFDRHAYPKGARVLHMLRFELGDELFWKAIQRYGAVNQFRTVETADLRRAIEDATGQGLNWFFDQWVDAGGHPEFEIAWRWDSESKTARVTVKQKQRVDAVTPLFKSDVEIELAGPFGVEIKRVAVSQAEETFHFTLDSAPTRVCFDPRDWLLKEVTFAKDKPELFDQLANSQHVLCRADAARDLGAFSPDADAREALAAAVRGDAFWAVRQEAAKALGKFPGAEARETLIATARGDARSHVRRAAIVALGDYGHADTTATLRDVVREDPSYYAIADALRSLVKVDREAAAEEALAALERDSHRDTILEAACNVLVDLRHEGAIEKMRALLESPLSPDRRIQLIGALSRLKGDEPAFFEAILKELDNSRPQVRRAAIDALAKLGDARAIESLLSQRSKEETRGMIRAIDEAVEKLRAEPSEVSKLQKDLAEAKEQNRRLEERLEKLEAANP